MALRKKNPTLAFEHRFLRAVRLCNPQKKPILIAVSGGADSLVLLHVLKKWQKLLKIDLAVAHIHHGLLPKKSIKFRREAALKVQRAAAPFPFFSNLKWSDDRQFTLFSQPKKPKQNEGQLREFRWSELKRLAKLWAGDRVLIATAHSSDDLLETRVLRLLRGTGLYGLKGMSESDAGIVRPLLEFSANEIRQYAKRAKLKWCEDPSNRSLEPRRNWLRKFLFPQLEKKFPGSLQALARSLQNIAATGSAPLSVVNAQNWLSFADKKDLSQHERRTAIAQFLRDREVFNYSTTHLDEFLKRLDKIQKRHTFRLLGRVWLIDAQRLSLGRDSVS